jgi:hypothetical protein
VDGRQPVLIVIQGPEPGIIYRLPDNRVTTIGRSMRNSIVVVNPSVSRFHCELSYVNGRWELHDLNSRKGTIVNGEALDGSRRLIPGDIIRMSSAVFRFDLVDEAFDQDGALLAIKEAELDARLSRQQEKAQWLDQVMARNRLDSKDEDQPEAAGASVLASFLFVLVVAGLVVAGSIVARSAGRPAMPVPSKHAVAARSAYLAATEALAAGKAVDAVQKLQHVQEAFPNTDEARQAALKLQAARGAVLDQELDRMAGQEADGDYADALGTAAELKKLDLGPGAAGLLAAQEELATRLARAAYTGMDKDARRLLQQGDRAGALKLYRRMRESVGIPELSAQADAKVKEIEPNG